MPFELPESKNIYVVPDSNEYKPIKIITDDYKFDYNEKTRECTASKLISLSELIEILKENDYDAIHLDQN